MIILGINDMSRDSSACIIQDGRLVAAVSEERVSRLKHCGGYPGRAIREVLALAGVQAGEVDRVAVGNSSAETLMRLSTHVLGIRDVKERIPASLMTTVTLGAFTTYRKIAERVPYIRSADRALSHRLLQWTLRREGFTAPVDYFDHHLSHAASAFHTSGFKKALVLSLDAYGDGRSGALFLGKGAELEQLASFPTDASLGEFYGAVTALLGYQFGNDEGKIMALAAFGKPELLPLWKKRLKVNGMSLEGDFTRLRRFTYRELLSLKGTRLAEDIAASAQALLEETACKLVENALEQTGYKKLCLAGGVALNVKMNQRLLELPAITDVHIFPAPADDGTAVGAALLLSALEDESAKRRLTSTALGPSYSREYVEDAINHHPLSQKLTVSEYDPQSIAKVLAGGTLVGWFQGRMEFGPRALGQRSLIADPRSRESPSQIRKTIKRRPEFQPFCPSISAGYAREFIINRKGVPAQFMSLAFPTNESKAKEVPAVVHVDGTSRPQVVHRDTNKAYHDIIRAFGVETGIEGVLNTSLNRSGEPIVRTPHEALNLLLTTDLDLLIMEGLAITRLGS